MFSSADLLRALGDPSIIGIAQNFVEIAKLWDRYEQEKLAQEAQQSTVKSSLQQYLNGEISRTALFNILDNAIPETPQKKVCLEDIVSSLDALMTS